MMPGGWQRAWIFVSLVLVIPVAIWIWLTLPGDEDIKNAWAHAALLIIKGNDEREWPSVAAIRQALYRGLDNEAVISRVRSDVQRVHERSARQGARSVPTMVLEMALVDEYYGRQLAALRARQLNRMALGGTVWLCLVVLVYALATVAARLPRRSGS
ncbi:MAG: hypothetical protein ACT4P8_01640 [Betaproteobacteria bacterium]